MSVKDRQKTRQLNLLVLITTCTNIFFFFIHIFVTVTYVSAVLNSIFFLFYILTLIFSVKKRIYPGIYWIITVYLFQITLYSNVLYSKDAGYHFFYIVVPPIMILMLKKEDTLKKIFYSFFTLSLFFLAEYKVSRPAFAIQLSDEINHFLYEISLFICFTGNILVTLNYYIEILKVESQLSDQAGLDPLTGIANRRQFYTQFEMTFNCSRRYEAELSLLMIDIDHFKKINDSHGHQVGDEAIIWLTEEIKNCIRDSDIFARYGGEEFCLLLPRASEEKAAITAEKIRRKIESTTMISSSGLALNMTISCGISNIVNSGTEDYDRLIQYADSALYTAKETGRNKCVVYSASES